MYTSPATHHSHTPPHNLGHSSHVRATHAPTQQGVPDLAWVFAGSAATWLALGAWSVSKRGYVASGLKPGWRWVKGSVQVRVRVRVRGGGFSG